MGTEVPRFQIEQASDLLKSVGLRRTIGRINLLLCLAGQDVPCTQAEIGEALAVHGFDDSTIFRGLTDLTDAGLVVRIDAGDRVWRFELRDREADGSLSERHHPHAICLECGRVSCLSAKLASQLDQASRDWIVHDLIVRGICSDCESSRDTVSQAFR